MVRLIFACLLAAGGLVCTAASATPIIFAFTGSVTQTNFDPTEPPGGTIQFGTSLTGSFTFESTSPDLIPSTNQGSFQVAGPPYELNVTLGGQSFLIQDFLAINTFRSGVAQYGVLACSGGSWCGTTTFSLLLSDSTGTALSSDGLPLTPPSVNAFDTSGFRFSGSVAGNQVDVEGRIDSLLLGEPEAAAPEPGAWWLCLAGLGVILLKRR